MANPTMSTMTIKTTISSVGRSTSGSNKAMTIFGRPEIVMK